MKKEKNMCYLAIPKFRQWSWVILGYLEPIIDS